MTEAGKCLVQYILQLREVPIEAVPELLKAIIETGEIWLTELFDRGAVEENPPAPDAGFIRLVGRLRKMQRSFYETGDLTMRPGLSEAEGQVDAWLSRFQELSKRHSGAVEERLKIDGERSTAVVERPFTRGGEHVNDTLQYVKYRVELQTRPSPGLEFYRGFVVCHAASDADNQSIFHAAVRELQRTSFPERGVNCWKMIDFARA